MLSDLTKVSEKCFMSLSFFVISFWEFLDIQQSFFFILFYIYLIHSRPGSKTCSEAASSMWATKASCTCLFTKLNLSGPLMHPAAVSSVFCNTLTFDFYFRSCCVTDTLETGVWFLDHTWTHRSHCKSMYSPPPRGSTVVKVLCYKSQGRWFDPSWCKWIFH